MTTAAVSLPLALTMGEPAGIAGEISLKAWLGRVKPHGGGRPVPPFFIIDDPSRLSAVAESLGLDVPVETIADPDEVPAIYPRALPVLPHDLPVPVEPGIPSSKNAAAVTGAIERAVRLVQAGKAAAVVTNPVHKSVLYGAGFDYPGQTEYLAMLDGADAVPVMMLACSELRVVPLTTHRALRSAIDAVGTDAILDCAAITLASLERDFGIAQPRLAIAGLNPHAGEAGGMGHEDETLIAPAVAALRQMGHAVTGPHAPDSLFHPAARATYDAAICMYHDQALIPLKTIDFERGVNITIGLSFVRSSPDHGTAFAIAGTGKASETSLISALYAADDIVAQRARRDR